MPGTMRKRGSDSWYLEVTVGTDFRGKPNRYSRTVHGTKKQAEKELAKFYSECEAGNVSKSNNLTVLQMCNMVMDRNIRQHLKQNTVKGYETILLRIEETIGNKKANKLKPIDVQDWVNYLSTEYRSRNRKNKKATSGLSPKTIRNTYSFLNMCYDTMIAWGELGTKPTIHIKLPKAVHNEIRSLTLDEVKILLTNLDDLGRELIDYKVSVLLALFCGLRRGEICGINEEDVDFDEMSIKIVRTRYLDKNSVIYEDTPKSDNSTRKVFVPNEVMEEIRSLIVFHKETKMLLGSKYKNSPALLKDSFGNPVFPNNIWRWHSNFLKKIGMEHITFHALRHTYASMLNYLGKDIAEISLDMGHSRKSTTLNIYTHMFQDMEQAKRQTAADLSNRILSRK